jgi:hypothetical protein
MPPLTEDQRAKIKEDYINGLSPLQIAHKHYREISEVLEVIGQGSMNHVHFVGDQLDGPIPGVQTVTHHTYQQHYDKN